MKLTKFVQFCHTFMSNQVLVGDLSSSFMNHVSVPPKIDVLRSLQCFVVFPAGSMILLTGDWGSGHGQVSAMASDTGGRCGENIFILGRALSKYEDVIGRPCKLILDARILQPLPLQWQKIGYWNHYNGYSESSHSYWLDVLHIPLHSKIYWLDKLFVSLDLLKDFKWFYDPFWNVYWSGSWASHCAWNWKFS